MAWPSFLNGTVVNLSDIDILVIETTTNHGKPTKPPAVVHLLKPGFRSPGEIDADGLKRADGKPIEDHPHWIKFSNPFTATVSGTSANLKVSVWTKQFVGDKRFGAYQMDLTQPWGEKVQKVTHIIKEHKITVGYILEGKIQVSKAVAFSLCRKGLLTNVILVRAKSGQYLRTLPDHETSNNLLVVSKNIS